MYQLPIFDTDDTPARKQIIQFGSYNDSPTIDDGDMRDMLNLSSDSYPFISQRKPRGIYNASYDESGRVNANLDMFEDPSALLSRREKLAVIDGTSFYYGEDEDGSPILIDYITLSDDGAEKTMVAINNKICIFPDKIWFDVRDVDGLLAGDEYKWGRLDCESKIYKTTTFPEEAQGGKNGWGIQPITRDSDDVMQYISFWAALPADGPEWYQPVIDYYDAFRFKKGDAVTLSGFVTTPANNITAVIQSVTISLEATTGGYQVYDITLGFPPSSFQATTASEQFENGYLTIKRACPDLSHVMESDNRLWGTCDSENAIYACKQGDPTNWYYYHEALASNSYAVSVATDGRWTGCCAYGAHLCFFKEDYIHRLYGTKPSNYQINTIEAQSVEAGSSRSIVVVNNTVFYKSRLGIMAYSGNVPELISEHFGTAKYKNVSAGTDGMKIWFSMESCDRAGEWDLFCFDVQKVMWHKEDHSHVDDFTYHLGKVIYIDHEKPYLMVMNADVPIIAVESAVAEEQSVFRNDNDIEWYAVFGDYDEYIEDKKIYSRMQLRMKMDEGADLTISIMCDESGTWEKVQHIFSEQKRSMYVPIVPRRCDKFRIRLEGKGRCLIESLAREYREGSEM